MPDPPGSAAAHPDTNPPNKKQLVVKQKISRAARLFRPEKLLKKNQKNTVGKNACTNKKELQNKDLLFTI